MTSRSDYYFKYFTTQLTKFQLNHSASQQMANTPAAFAMEQAQKQPAKGEQIGFFL